MTYFHVLVEGRADEPVVREILQQRFGLVAEADFRVHPHRGKGMLPAYPNNRPEPQRQGLLDLLPAKLRAWAKLQKITSFAPDAIVGAWERLAEALGRKPADCNGADKHEWATAIMPHVNLEHPISPSLRVFVDGLARYIAGSPSLRLTP